MDNNILAMLLQSVVGAQPGQIPEPVAQPTMPPPALGRLSGLSETLQGLGDDGTPAPIAAAAPPANIMQAAVAPPEMPQAPQPVEKPRQRRSLLDTVGRISDAFARFGGHEPGYQPTLDAREDRTYQQQLRAQQIAAGGDTAEGRQRAVLGQAVRGLLAIQARGGDVGVAWPLLARQAGIPEESVAQLGQIFTSDPNALTGFSAMLNEPQEQGSASTAIQNYTAYQRILAQQGPEAAQQFLALAQPSTEINPYQEAQLDDRREDRNFRRGENAADRAVRLEAIREAARLRTEAARLRTGGTGLTPTQRGAVLQTREAIPGIRHQLERVEEISQNLGSASGAVGGLVPGNIAGGSAAQYDRAQALLAAQIRTLIRTVGEGSMSDYESRLNVATLPARTDAPEGRREAIRNLRSLLDEIEARSRRLLTPVAATSAAPSNPERPAPRSGGSRPNPRVPAVGTVRQGYRFKGGNPASPSSWERAR